METTTQERTMFPIDLTTRAGRMIQAGRITVTFTSPSGQHITLTAKCRTTNEDGKWVASSLADAKVMFIEVPNETGWNDKVGKVTRSRGFVAAPGADQARVFCAEQLLRFVAGQDMGALRAQEATRCGKCGRELTDPVSIDRGIGPECYGSLTGSQHQVKQAAAPEAAPAPAPELLSPNPAPVDMTEITGDEYGAFEASSSTPATDKQGVPVGIGDWRERKDYATKIRKADNGEDESPRLAELRANSSQNKTRPGCDIFGAPLS